MTRMPKWSRRKPDDDPLSEIPLSIGPNTDQSAFRADLQSTLGACLKLTEADMLVKLREVCARHGVEVGQTVHTAKIEEPLRSIIRFGAARGQLRLVNAAGYWLLTDSRWALLVTEDQRSNLVSAGVSVQSGEFPAIEPIDGEPLPLDAKPSPLAMLERFGIGTSGGGTSSNEWANDTVFDLFGVTFAADVIAVLAVAGATRIVLDTERAEGRTADGRVVGYAMAFGTPRVIN
jgi:hypothetical protein